MKRCSVCEQFLPHEAFPARSPDPRTGRRYLASRCRACRAVQEQQRRLELHEQRQFTAWRALVGQPPCDTCPRVRFCAATGLTCAAFNSYVEAV